MKIFKQIQDFFLSFWHQSKMNPRIKRLWIKSLKESKSQNFRQLKHPIDNKFCALGHLYELYRQEFLDYYMWKGSQLVLKSDPAFWVLAQNVLDWAGIKQKYRMNWSPMIGDQTIIFLNDYKQLSLRQIAKLIKKYL